MFHREMSAEEIYSLFGRIFGGRQSPFAIFSRTLSGRVVFRRACASCRGAVKGRTDCARCRGGSFRPLSAEDIMAHINGGAAVGIYPADENGLCRFSVIEICDADIASALGALSEVCRAFSVSHLCEITDFGRRARLWLFFGGAVSPEAALFAAMTVLEEAAAVWPELLNTKLTGLLPSPGGTAGFGKPAVLPLFDMASGFSVLLDSSLKPASDPISLLADFNPDKPNFPPRASAVFPNKLSAECCGGLYINESRLSPRALAALCRCACVPNPDAGEFSAEPSVSRCFALAGGRLLLPRGVDLAAVMPETKVNITENSAEGVRVRLRFKGSLNDWQRRAQAEMLKRRIGVITAPVGTGKTLAVCAALTKIGRSALLLVPDRAAALRWQRRFSELFGIDAESVGCVMSERDFPNGRLDVCILNDRCTKLLAEYLSDYGTVVVADCDRLTCTGGVFRSVMEAVCARRVYALSSRSVETARLKDYIRLYCGETIYT